MNHHYKDLANWQPKRSSQNMFSLLITAYLFVAWLVGTLAIGVVIGSIVHSL